MNPLRAFASGVGDVWRHRDLLRNLVLRNIRVKYQRSVVGLLWALLNPLLTAGALVVVFTRVVPLDLPRYWAFLLSGYFVWRFVLQNLTAGTFVLAQHGALRRTAPFPQEVVILGHAGSRLVEFGAEMLLVTAALVLFHHHAVPESFLLLPLLIVLQLLLVVGLVLPVAVASAFYTDVQHAMPAALLTLFYLSPVFYPLSQVPEDLRPLYLINPVASLLTLFHVVLYEGRLPSAGLLGGAAATASIIALLGYAFFRRTRSVLAEIL
jgi:ABC-type polysaccharide/polyol phosphate export permease